MTAVQKGDRIVVGRQGMRVLPAGGRDAQARTVRVHGQPGVEREAEGGERPRDRRRPCSERAAAGEKVLVVLGPAVVHTGSGEHVCQLIRDGYHQRALRRQCPGHARHRASALRHQPRRLARQRLPAEEGHEHHLRAINTIRRLGGIATAVETAGC